MPTQTRHRKRFPHPIRPCQPITTPAINSTMASSNTISNGISSGYAPNILGIERPKFDGNPSNYIEWDTRFKNYLRRLKLAHVLKEENPNEDQNADVFMELIDCIDGTSLRLVNNAAAGNGKKAFEILSNHYLGTEEFRVRNVLTEFMSMKHSSKESITQYCGRIDEIKKVLEGNNIIIPDGLYTVMAMKGLPDKYDVFRDVINTQKDMPTFSDFKIKLKVKEIEMNSRIHQVESASVFAVKNNSQYNSSRATHKYSKTKVQCYKCKKIGHTQQDCRSNYTNTRSNPSNSRWCDILSE